ncbi:MAG: hypothetical protein LBI13_01660 [Streptococcaceae bacterium]|jgi:hypothetical protein|nr:hypothetical protein [Streptococcaceae bacterium]
MKKRKGNVFEFGIFYQAIEEDIPIYIDKDSVKVIKFIENDINFAHSRVWVGAFVDFKRYPMDSGYCEALYRYDGKNLKAWFDCDLEKDAETVYQDFCHRRLHSNQDKVDDEGAQ